VSFAYRNDAQRVTHYGLIAEEVARVYPELVARTATGWAVQAVRCLESQGEPYTQRNCLKIGRTGETSGWHRFLCACIGVRSRTRHGQFSAS
jgi:hypothetical protein